MAERCLKRKDLTCARGRLTAALALAPDDLRVSLLNLKLLRAEQRRWTLVTINMLDRMWRKSPKSVVVLRSQLELEADAKCNLCAMNSSVDTLLAKFPGTPWMVKLKKFIQGKINSDSLWALRDRELREDLAAMVAMARKAGTKVLLLNYASEEYEGDPCSREVGVFYHKFSKAFSVGLIDIEGLLKPGGTTVKEPREDFSDGGHPSAQGYGKIARQAMKRMAAEGWLE